MELCIILKRIGHAAFPLEWRQVAATALLIGSLGLAGCSEPDENVAEQAASAAAAPTISRERIEASLNAAEDYLRGGKFREAEAILIRLLDRAPDEVDAHELYAQLLISRANDALLAGQETRAQEFFRAAYDRYERMTDLLPRSAELHQVAGEIAQTAGLIDRALLHYRRAEELDAANPRYAIFAAQILMERGANDDAQRMLERANMIDPDEPLVYATFASLAAKQGDWERAIEHARAAREIAPRDLSYRVLEASLHRQRGKPEVGVQLLMHLSEDQKAKPFVASELAYAYTALGEHERVGEVWARRYQANPSATDAWESAIRAAQAMARAGRREQARLWLDEARLSGADDAAIRAVERVLREESESHE